MSVIPSSPGTRPSKRGNELMMNLEWNVAVEVQFMGMTNKTQYYDEMIDLMGTDEGTHQPKTRERKYKNDNGSNILLKGPVNPPSPEDKADITA